MRGEASQTDVALRTRDLAIRAASGDADATAVLLSTIRPGVVRYCRARLGRYQGGYGLADDVAQEVCLGVLSALPRFDDRGRPFSALVYAIAANKVADAQRAALRSSTVTLTDDLPDLPDQAPGPEQQVVAADLSRRLSSLLAHLSDTHREVIVLRVAVGLTAAEVGAALGMTATAVRVAQSRALVRLRTLADALLDEAVA